MSSLNYQSFIGNARAVDILRRAIARDHLPHAMIFAGPSGVGKCTLALMIARHLNCLAPGPEDACGACSSCKRISAVLASRHQKCEKGDKVDCGSCSVCKLRDIRHPDIRLIEPEKTVISIDQIRNIIGEIAFQPIEARYRVVIFDPAEQMRQEAQNSLLKTLEEPASRTVMILVTRNPYMLLETIRSRCRTLHFGEIPRERIARYLMETTNRSKDEAQLAASMSGGSLEAALDFNSGEYKAIREWAQEFVELLLGEGSFYKASLLAAKAAKDKEVFEEYLDSIAALLQDIYYAGVAVERVGQLDLLESFQTLRRRATHSLLLRAIEGVRKIKSNLQYNVNRQIALEAFFLEVTGA